MYAFAILVVLTLALAVVHQTLNELLPVKTPDALTRTVTVAIAILFAWGIDYSVFTAFGQTLRAEWMHPVVTGVVLVASGEFIRSVVQALAHRAGEPSVEVAPQPGLRAA
ncbi:MAG: hypothetical protein R3249_07355 [Nitriliruptorales bacterium]|nr:hypothetical protein [Nitriliruptorales bacterium]